MRTEPTGGKVVFWDFDGTLVQHKPLWSAAVLRVLQRSQPGCGVRLEEVRPLLRTGFPWHTPDRADTRWVGPAFWTQMAVKFREVYRRLGVDAEDAARLAGQVRAEILRPENYAPYPDAAAALAGAQRLGYRNWMLSNNYPELPELVGRLGLGRYFDGYVVSALVGYDKPRPEIFERALALAGHPAVRWMVGDNPVADVEGAQRCGIPAVLVHEKADCGAQHCFSTLAEVLGVLA